MVDIMTEKFDKSWLINQLIIFVFGFGMSLIGYKMFMNRAFTVHHYHITVDLGMHHQTIGLVVLIVSAVICVFSLIGFFRKNSGQTNVTY